jgi:hypothetical protein
MRITGAIVLLLFSLLLSFGCLGVSQKAYDELNQTNVQLQGQISVLNSSNVQCQSQVSTLQSQISALQSQVSDLQKQISDLEAEIGRENIEKAPTEPIAPEKLMVNMNVPVWFDKENNFTHWSVRLDGADISPKLPRSALGNIVTTSGKNLSAGDHTLAIAFYYPDGWWVRLVWNVTVPDKMFDQEDNFDMGGFIINVTELADQPAKLTPEQAPPLLLIGPDPQNMPLLTPQKVNCTVHIKEVNGIVDIKRPTDADWVIPEAGMSLAEGTQISTGYDSNIVLDLIPVPPCENKTVNIKSLSQVNVTRDPDIFANETIETKLKIDTGTINVDVKKGELKTDLKIATPNTTCTISG